MYRPLHIQRALPLLALLAMPIAAVADDDDDEHDEDGITACELCDELSDLARDCAREFGEGHVNDVVCDALAAAETAACPPEEGEDTSDGTARDGWGDDDDDDDDDAQGDDGECDCDDEHEDDHDDCDDDEDDNRVCTDQCGEVQGLLDACTAELGAGHEHCEELQEIADECAQNEPPADTGDTDAATSRIRALASCDVMGGAGMGGLIGALGLLGLWMRRSR